MSEYYQKLRYQYEKNLKELEQREENESISNSDRYKAKFIRGIKIEEATEMNKGKELVRILKEVSKGREQKILEQDNYYER